MTFETINFKKVQVAYSAFIMVNHSFIAQHRWAACPFPEQAFLKNWHRHVFGVKVQLVMQHNDRDLEFFRVQNTLREVCKPWEHKQVEKSCEMFGVDILKTLLEMGYPVLGVRVDEDGENEAQIMNRSLTPLTQMLDAEVPEALAQQLMS